MARTTIIAQAQNADNLTTPGYITPDNISTDLVQYRLSGDNEIFALGTIYTAYQWIIKGDGVNGKVVGSYPPTDTDPVFLSFSAGYNWPQGNVSEIFTYLNAGGPNVKYTKFTYNVKRYNTTSFINPNTRGQGIEWDRNVQNDISLEVEIYWGKYTKFNLTTVGPVTFIDISKLSGKTNAAARSLSFSSTGTQLDRLYPEIDLDTRRITKLPRYFLDGSANGHKLCDHFWRIETDDFATTVTAPTPQETTEEVSGTKISQLSSTTTVQDSDLFVISRDDVSQGEGDISYDNSYNLGYKTISDTISSQIISQIPPLPLYKVAYIDPSGNFLKNGDSDGNYAFASCSRYGGGQYAFTFGESVPNKNDYVVNVTRLMSNPLEGDVVVVESTRSTTGFSVFSSNDNSTPADPQGLYVVVYLLS